MSNIAPQSRFQFDKNKHILRQDIIFADSRAHNLLQWTKTLQESTSRHFVQIPALSNLVICSVLALKQLIASRCLSQSSPLFANNVPPYLPVIDTIRDALHLDHIGIPLLGHGFYIFRRSGATYAYDNNVQLQHIMTHSLWRSSAVLTYLQNASLAPPVIPATFAAIIPHHIKLGLGF